MFKPLRIGSLLGFPLEVNPTFLVLLAVFLFWLGPVTGLIFVVVAFGSVLLHELGHAVVARHLKVPVAGIELHFFGGAAKLTRQPRTAGDEIAIAAAGPAVSFALGGIGLVASMLVASPVLVLLAWINLIMGAFNLLPALPMDGGRIFRALLSRRMGFLRATEVSVTVARGLAIAGGAWALFTGQFFLAAIAFVVWTMGTAELQAARQMAAHRRGGYFQVEVLPPGARPRREPPRDRDEPRFGSSRPPWWDQLR